MDEDFNRIKELFRREKLGLFCKDDPFEAALAMIEQLREENKELKEKITIAIDGFEELDENWGMINPDICPGDTIRNVLLKLK